MNNIKVEVEICPADFISEIPTDILVSEIEYRDIKLLSNEDYKILRNMFIKHDYDKDYYELYQKILSKII